MKIILLALLSSVLVVPPVLAFQSLTVIVLGKERTATIRRPSNAGLDQVFVKTPAPSLAKVTLTTTLTR